MNSGVSAYLEALKHYGEVTVPGLDSETQPIPIENVFVEPQLQISVSGKRASPAAPGEPGATPETESAQGVREVSQPEPAITVLQNEESIAILGEPGQGKSTLLRQYARILAQEPHGLQLPLLVEFRRQRERARRIEEPFGWLRERVPGELKQAWGQNGWEEICKAMESRKATVLLDGYDELQKGAQQEVRGLVPTLAGNRVVLTSRPHAYRLVPLRGFRVYRLQDLLELQIRLLATNVCRASQSQYNCDDFLPALNKVLEVAHGRAAAIARNPLFLSFMCLTAVKKLGEGRLEEFPIRAAPLIAECVGALVAWHRTHKEDWPEDLLASDVLRILAPLALEGFKDESALIRQEALDKLDPRDKHVILKYFVAARFVEQRDGDYVFPIETFREYFAALAVAATADPFEEVKAHLHDPGWEKVIVYTAGSLAGTRASRIDLALPGLARFVKWVPALGKLAGKIVARYIESVPQLEGDSGVAETALEMLGTEIKEPLERWLAHSRCSTEFFLSAMLKHRCLYERLLARDLRLAARCLLEVTGYPDRLARRLVRSLVRRAARRSFVTSRGQACLSALREAVTSPPVWKSLLALHESRDWTTRRAVAEVLAPAAHEDQVQIALEKMSRDPKHEVSVAADDARKEAVRQRERHGAQVSPVVFAPPARRIRSPYEAMMGRVLGTPPSQRELNDSFLLVADASQPGDRARLIDLTRDRQWGVRRDAAEKLRPAVTDLNVQQRLLELTADDFEEVRKAAAAALAKAASEPRVVKRLREMIRGDSANVCAAAAAALKGSGLDNVAMDRILELTRHREATVRADAATALQGFADDRGVQKRLLRLTRDGDNSVRVSALQALRGWVGPMPRRVLTRLAFVAWACTYIAALLLRVEPLGQPESFLSVVDAQLEADESWLTLEVLLQTWEQQKRKP